MEKFRSLTPRVEDDDEVSARLTRERCEREARGVGRKFLDIDLFNLQPELPSGYKRMAAHLLRMIDQPTTTALLGGVGVGKTGLACGLIRAFQEHGKRYTKILKASKYMAMLADAPFGKGAKERIHNDYARFQLLIIDEVENRGTSGGSDWTHREFESLIDDRYQAELPTILISNLSAENFPKDVGERVYRRITEQENTGGGVLIANWPRLAPILQLAA